MNSDSENESLNSGNNLPIDDDVSDNLPLLDEEEKETNHAINCEEGDCCNRSFSTKVSLEKIKNFYVENYGDVTMCANVSKSNITSDHEDTLSGKKRRVIKLQPNKTVEELIKEKQISNKKKATVEDRADMFGGVDIDPLIMKDIPLVAKSLFNSTPSPEINGKLKTSLPTVVASKREDSLLDLNTPESKKFLQECEAFMSLITIRRIVNKNCCSRGCLQTNLAENEGMDLSPCYNFVHAVRSDLVGKNLSERSLALSLLINGSKDGITGAGRPRMKYQLFSQTFKDGQKFSFCAKSFCFILGMSKTLRQKICNSSDVFNVSDLINATNQIRVPGGKITVTDSSFKTVKSILQQNKIVLNNKSLSYFVVPDGDKSMKAHAWLDQFFQLVGDKQPNKFDEIHLDCITRKSVWQEYCCNMLLFYGDQPKDTLSYAKLCALWDECFSNVKVRVYKNVSGHCKTCERLSALRRDTKDNYKRGLLTQLHAYHRHLYMGERESYYFRQMEAMLRPNDYMSIITDGMNQQHSKVPYLANLNEFGQQETLIQHLQLTIEHGQRIDVYRTLGNIKNDRNPAIHSLLLQLEKRLANFGFLPPTLYIQVDGGPENANETLLAFLALIVARRLGNLQRIVLTRLPVGHTHEDGDGLFGNLWKATRNQSVFSPEHYKALIEQTFKKDNMDCFVHDIIVTPDYFEIIKDCVDPSLSHLWKLEYTKLQWIFNAVEPDEKHRFGVETKYRAFVQEENFEIIPVDRLLTPAYDIEYRVRHSFHKTFPLDDEPPINILIEPPNGIIMPKGFIRNSADSLLVTLRKVASYFGDQKTLDEWQRFKEKMPVDDNVINYINREETTWHIPLEKELFGSLCAVDTTTIVPPVVRVYRKANKGDKKKDSKNNHLENITNFDREVFNHLPIQVAESTASVIHSGNKKMIIPEPRNVISDAAVPVDPASKEDQLFKYIMNLGDKHSAQTLNQLVKEANMHHGGRMKLSYPNKKDTREALQNFYQQRRKNDQAEAKLELKDVNMVDNVKTTPDELTKAIEIDKIDHLSTEVDYCGTIFECKDDYLKAMETILDNGPNKISKDKILKAIERGTNFLVVSKNKQRSSRSDIVNFVIQELKK